MYLRDLDKHAVATIASISVNPLPSRDCLIGRDHSSSGPTHWFPLSGATEYGPVAALADGQPAPAP